MIVLVSRGMGTVVVSRRDRLPRHDTAGILGRKRANFDASGHLSGRLQLRRDAGNPQASKPIRFQLRLPTLTLTLTPNPNPNPFSCGGKGYLDLATWLARAQPIIKRKETKPPAD